MNEIFQTEPRRTVQVHLADGRTFEGPVGTPLSAFIDLAYPDAEPPIAAALVNDDLRELGIILEDSVTGTTWRRSS